MSTSAAKRRLPVVPICRSASNRALRIGAIPFRYSAPHELLTASPCSHRLAFAGTPRCRRSRLTKVRADCRPMRRTGGSLLMLPWYWQIVELAHVAARIPRIPLVGPGVPLDIERDCFPQAVQQPIVEERLSQREVAERRGLEQATEFLATRKIGAQGSAGAEIEKCGIGIGRDVMIARHSDRNQPVIGESRRGRIAPSLR
jgi:hypothetical protein